MKRRCFFLLAALLVPGALVAQAASSGANPTTEAARGMDQYYGGLLMSAADQVPADKLAYKPTAGQRSFGQVWAHLAGANRSFCSAIGVMAAPETPHRDGTEDKATLVQELKDSFAFCDEALAATDDSKLGEQLDLGFMEVTRATAMFIYVADLADHYSQVANYMRLNDMLPPSAQQGEGE